MEDEQSNISKDILKSCLDRMKVDNEELKVFILAKSEEGFYETHQSAGNIKSFAKDILNIAYKVEKRDENKDH